MKITADEKIDKGFKKKMKEITDGQKKVINQMDKNFNKAIKK